ncbi:hypothetical protein BKA65DRAFT_522347 [Rhexocercosporidium sp. MPI-PUGE-AT-0058]|nr:hypothetical protein BKA65DRAFT_522347 [Rhexocercosporidium sp. MPI-PUGE-AT-0058]
MSGRLDADPDFEFFESNLEGVSSPGFFLAEDLTTDPSQFLTNFGTPNTATQKSPLPEHSSLLDTRVQQSLSAPSTASPAGSYQDSSSESSGYKRKSSSDSSRSADIMMADTDMGDWKVEESVLGNDASNYGVFEGTINPAAMSNFEFSDKTMENDFDFESAASSPSPFRIGPVDSPEMPIIKQDTPRRHSPLLKSKYMHHDKRNSQHSVTQSMNGLTTAGSREASPLSAMVTSQESSPSAFFNNSPSPGNNVDFMNTQMLGGPVQNPGWAAGFGGYPNNGLPAMPQGLSPQHMPPRMAPQPPFAHMGPPFKPVMTLHPTPLKSRVETQIPIKMTLFPMPIGITKLHLPTHTISKPKLLAKPTPPRSPDTLELYTSLVCTSAMQNPEARRRAFERAASGELPTTEESSPGESGSDEDDENKPLNGGDVKICVGCITRERKRAARKKVKKVEEEESWHKDEAKRVIVFNTHEVKEWQPPSSQPPSETTGDRPEPFVPDGAMQVDAPMRIACYCRHQNEKLGFQVIFTIKDYQDRLIAQEMTSSIMITDDHKTHTMPTLTTQTSNGSDSQMFSGSGTFPADPTFDMSSVPPANLGAFRVSHSSSDLQGMQNQNFNMQFPPPHSATTSSLVSQATSTTATPRNLSRQTSPSVSLGPTSKKRKASGSSKVPSGLAMTRLETGDMTNGQGPPTGSMTANNSTVQSPFTPNMSAFSIPDQQFNPAGTTIPNIPQQYNTGPPTPNSNDQVFFSNNNRSQSMDNLAMHQLFSAPASAHPSRVPSPNGPRNNVQAYQQQAQIAQAVANGLYGLPLNLNPHRQPTIHKMIPNEGPKAGGIEVTCLGSGFCQGLEVMFGDSKATTTTYWGETSLVCLLPPSAFAGTVAVTFKHQHQQQQMQPYPSPPVPKSQTFFKYVDDDEQQIIRTALSVLGHKMTGKMEDVRDLARRIVGDGPSSWGGSAGPSPTGGNHNQNVNGFNMATFGVDVEATLLKCLDLIDLDDSPRQARLNMRRASGQTMLHLACSMGLHRFVAGLLARGANPEPRDKGGFTPMHFAALHNHPQIVRRLMLSGADPTIRSLQGYTPSDMATSEEVLRAARRIEHHTRTRSGSSLRSRTSSATSLRSVWEPSSPPAPVDMGEDSDDEDHEYEDEDADAAHDGAFWMKSRRPSAQKPSMHEVPEINPPVMEIAGVVPGGLASPTAAMAAFRDHIAAQVQQFQQTMHSNLPNLPQMPRFDMMNLPDYQAYLQTGPMVRRISNLVGTHTNRPDTPKEQDYRWWDLFSGTVPAAPPAYEDIFPQEEVDKKHALAVQAAADTVADKKCAEMFDQAESSTMAESRTMKLDTVRIGQKHIVTREQQDQLRAKHAEKVKRLSRDRNLFFIWIPILLLIILAMLYNRVPQAWSGGWQVIDSIRNRQTMQQGRIVEVL